MSYQINLFYIYIFKLINDRIMMCTDLFFDSLNGLIFKILNTTHLHCLLFYIACIKETTHLNSKWIIIAIIIMITSQLSKKKIIRYNFKDSDCNLINYQNREMHNSYTLKLKNQCLCTFY